MSLIGEALKRLSEEERPPHLGRPHLPVPGRSLWPWVIAAAAVSLAIGVLVGVALLPRASPSPPVAEPPPATVLGGATEPPPSVPDSAVAPAAPPQPVVEAAAPSPRPSEVATQPPSRPSVEAPSRPTESPLPRGEPLVTGNGDQETSASSLAAPSTDAGLKVPRPEAGHTYFGRVMLPGGDEIVLNGIAWSDASPVALLESGVFSPGEGANSWVVAGIGPRQVEIEWDGIRFFVRMR